MATYVVSYDLNQQGQNYDCIIKKLKAYGTHWHMQQSVWIIVADASATQIRDNLKSCLDSNDKLFVAKLSGEAAWSGYRQTVTDWLKKYLSYPARHNSLI